MHKKCLLYMFARTLMSSIEILTAYLLDQKDAKGVVEYVRAQWPKSLSTYISAIKKQWMTMEIHDDEYPRHYADALAKVNEMVKTSSGCERAVLLKAKEKLEAFHAMSLSDKYAMQRRIRTVPYSGHALVDDVIIGLVILPPYIVNDLRVTVAERAEQQKKATAALEARSVQSITIQGSELIAKCRATLKDTRANAFDLAVALALTTGRRMIELFKTGTLTPVGEDHRMRFEGQVKKSAFAETGAYDIPVLAPPEIIKKALARLRTEKDCSELTKREGNLKWSNSCNAAARRLMGDDVHFHSLRAMYAVLTFNAALPHKHSLNMFVSRVLGHANLGNSISYTSIHVENLKKTHKFVWREAM